MKKLISVLWAVLLCLTMYANSYWYAGSSNGWNSAAMTESTQGTYEYLKVAKQSETLQFKIQLASGDWSGALDKAYTSAGFAGTDVTNMNSASSTWNENINGNNTNCCIWYIDKAFYVIVFKPNTTVNTTSKPIICASTALPVETTPTPDPDAPKFYVTGDSALVVDAGAGVAKKWTPNAIPSQKDTCVLSLKGGVDYKLKLTTDGTWSTAKGYNDITETGIADGLTKDNDGNICFKLAETGEVKVIYTGSLFKLTGNFYVKQVVLKDIKFVPRDWATDSPKYAAWIWGGELAAQWTSFFTGTGDTLTTKIDSDAQSIIFVRLKDTATEPNWNDKLNQTVDETVDYESLTYTITGWGTGEDPKSTGTWEAYVPAKFYITGDSALIVDAGFDKSKAWSSDAIKSTTDSYVLNLKGGVDYKLKVTDGTWYDAETNPDAKNLGYTDITPGQIAEGLSKDGDNNICFKLAADGSVTVTCTESLFKLEGNFYAPKAEKRIVKLVPSEEWQVADAKFAAWIWGENMEARWTAFFTPVSAGNDTLKAEIISTADSIDFVRFSPKTSVPTWEQPQDADVLVWGEAKDAINWNSLTATIVGWDSLTWAQVEKPCESFGLIINGVYKAGKKNVLQSEWLEYVLRNVELKKGDKLQVRNDCADADWAITTYAPTSYEFTITDNKYVVGEDGSYDFYLKLLPGGDEIYISKAGFYTSSVPSQCEDVMLQAFYNESYSDNAPGVSATADYKLGLGNTRWITLLAQAEELAHSFDLIWLPPSANGDGMGYHPKNYSNQNSNWGSRAELEALISALHDGGAKVVADIVINHCQSTYGWLGFPEFDFGELGKFQPTGAWVCKNDEVNTNPAAGSEMGKATGNYDDGENWEGARDWAHDMPEVQNMFKAYLKWMRDTMKYDGFRYDKGDGFNNWHHDNYNKAVGPYIAFMECYSGTDEIQSRIAGANYNLMGLDFDTKWHVFNSFAGWDYSRYRGDGMLGRNDGRHAVEFIDSHDWFLRDDNENEFGGRGNSLTEAMKARLLQANAFLLSMPGVPCVFYPHWAKYKEYLKPMIEARKLAGVHSESEVRDEYASSTGYQATIVGKYGYLILCLGKKAHQSSFAGYELKASYYETNDAGKGKDASYQIWVNRTTPIATGVEELSDDKIQAPKAEKFMKEGKIYIRLGDKTYDVLGIPMN